METKPRLIVPDKEASTQRFVAIICEVLGVESISTDQHFLDAGGDSLSIAIIIDWVAQEFSVEPELDWFFGYPFALALMALTCFSLYVLFKRRHWL